MRLRQREGWIATEDELAGFVVRDMKAQNKDQQWHDTGKSMAEAKKRVESSLDAPMMNRKFRCAPRPKQYELKGIAHDY